MWRVFSLHKHELVPFNVAVSQNKVVPEKITEDAGVVKAEMKEV